jgi:hypothetical protein
VESVGPNNPAIDNVYSADLFVAEASRHITQYSPASGKSLYMYLAFQNVHDPYEVPQKYIDMYPHLATQPHRQNFSAMVTSLDDAVHQVTTLLQVVAVGRDMDMNMNMTMDVQICPFTGTSNVVCIYMCNSYIQPDYIYQAKGLWQDTILVVTTGRCTFLSLSLFLFLFPFLFFVIFSVVPVLVPIPSCSFYFYFFLFFFLIPCSCSHLRLLLVRLAFLFIRSFSHSFFHLTC